MWRANTVTQYTDEYEVVGGVVVALDVMSSEMATAFENNA
jgi:hypothetical protein